MKLRVSYFAAFREAAGVSSERVESGAATATALFAECAERHPGLQRYTASLVAINEEMTGWDAALADGDEVLFFPPVAGG
jgi:molybdopterin converting factor subunit 1